MKIYFLSYLILLILSFIALSCNNKHEPQIGFIGLNLGESEKTIDAKLTSLQKEGKITNISSLRESFDYYFKFDQEVKARVVLMYGGGYLYQIIVNLSNSYNYDEIISLYKDKYKGKWEQFETQYGNMAWININGYKITISTSNYPNFMTIDYEKKEDIKKDI